MTTEKKGSKPTDKSFWSKSKSDASIQKKKWGINPSEEWEKYGKEILLHNFGKYDKRANTQTHTYWHRTEERIARTIFTLYWLSDALNIYDSIRAKEEKKKAKSRSSVCFFFFFRHYDGTMCALWHEDMRFHRMNWRHSNNGNGCRSETDEQQKKDRRFKWSFS